MLAIWTGYIVDRIGSERIKVYFHRLLRIFERLEKFPMRYLTGYFVAVKAIKKLTEKESLGKKELWH
jgi:hypothetical protein